LTEAHCESCGAPGVGLAPWRCEQCGSPLEPDLPPPAVSTFADVLATGVWRYRGWLPPAEPVTLGEPQTGLVELPVDGRTVFAKLESELPTGSFKDRGTTVTVSTLHAHGVSEIAVDSSGNAGASFAAYAARAGMQARVFVPADASSAKLLQVRAHGATVVAVAGPRSAAGDAARAYRDDAGPDIVYASHLWQPAFLAGTATFAYELFEQLGRRAPDVIVAPLGGGTLLLGAHLGFARLMAAGLIDRIPRLVGVQSSACAPLARAFRTGEPDAVEVEPDATIAEGIRIARPPRARQILAAVRQTGGVIVEVTDDEIRTSLRTLLARGLFVEPTAAAAYAGVVQATLPDERVVVALTGHGLKSVGAISELVAGVDPTR
jgi:threonine synthase